MQTSWHTILFIKFWIVCCDIVISHSAYILVLNSLKFNGVTNLFPTQCFHLSHKFFVKFKSGNIRGNLILLMSFASISVFHSLHEHYHALIKKFFTNDWHDITSSHRSALSIMSSNNNTVLPFKYTPPQIIAELSPNLRVSWTKQGE